jgi:hypothetical protein
MLPYQLNFIYILELKKHYLTIAMNLHFHHQNPKNKLVAPGSEASVNNTDSPTQADKFEAVKATFS